MLFQPPPDLRRRLERSGLLLPGEPRRGAISLGLGLGLTMGGRVQFSPYPTVANEFWRLTSLSSPKKIVNGAANITTSGSAIGVAHGAAIAYTDNWFASFWFRPTVTTLQEVLSKLKNDASIGWECYVSSASLTFHIAGSTTLTWSGTVTAGTLYHVIIGMTSGVPHIQVNGGTVETAAAATLTDSGQEFTIGGYSAHSLGSVGMFDSVGIGAGTPSTALRASLYGGGNGKTWSQLTGAEQASFEAWWDLGDAGTWADSTGHGHGGTTVGTVNNNVIPIPAGLTTPADTDGLPFLIDGSTSNYDLTQYVSGSRATYVASGVNGQPTVRCDGTGVTGVDATSKFFPNDSNIYPTGAKTFWMAYRCRAIPVNPQEYNLFALNHGGGVGTEFWPAMGLTGYLGIVFGMDATSGAHIPGVNVAPDTNWHVVRWDWDTSTYTLNFDNVAKTVDLTTSGAYGVNLGGFCGLGSNSPNGLGSFGSKLDVFAVIGATGVASGATDRAVRDWLNAYVSAYAGPST